MRLLSVGVQNLLKASDTVAANVFWLCGCVAKLDNSPAIACVLRLAAQPDLHQRTTRAETLNRFLGMRQPEKGGRGVSGCLRVC